MDGISTGTDGRNQPKLPIYLDYQATTPTDPRVLAVMLPYFTEKFGNPHSTSHSHGREAAEAVERARLQVARLIGADEREITFTSGATESNNLAIKGAMRFTGQKHRRVVTLVTEHKCVLESVKRLGEEGVETVLLPVRANGLLDLELLARVLEEPTGLVSIMAANNEIGVVQPLAEIGALCRSRGALFHTDAAQAAGKVPIDVEAMQIDLLSLSGHKLYGPKGIGALYVRRRPRVRLEPLFDGGAQERGLRSGTLAPPLCVGLGEACAISAAELGTEAARLRRLRDRLLRGLTAALPDLTLNGDPERRLPGNLNICVPGVDGQTLLADVPELSLSLGSACTSAAVEPSYVLRALGLPDELANGSFRIAVGRFTSDAEIDFAIERLVGAVRRLRDSGARA
ncbi:MAG: aminotransferase class V-fold PLP-dependent enzyme [Dongiaceae bacterium]